ncbi:arsenate reductase (glutaredoxin) [Xanthovirga aplysinae]|uniref:arsenate reductase (glutaredoxin) n=1 Tax=Xanthovirga aplysinae TaxID=2529853 RepID=UPI0012BD10E1|nr:arsenate reductase (glutaredoxin) [Xanthovirga aplysinae]MTI33337.1 arsenate reductase (glutaredoxin) [Xanthovirga aplysinae]
MIRIYHNPRCSKSRLTLGLLEEKNINVEVVEYLKTPPTEEELRAILDKIGIKAEKLVRKGEVIFKDNFKGKVLSEEEWIKAMVQFPKLIERPIVINGDKAVIARPPETVKEVL